jgi:hypothetical protein
MSVTPITISKEATNLLCGKVSFDLATRGIVKWSYGARNVGESPQPGDRCYIVDLSSEQGWETVNEARGREEDDKG